MARHDPSGVLCKQQPSNQASHLCEAPQLTDPHRLLHIVASLPMMFQGTVDAFKAEETSCLWRSTSRRQGGFPPPLGLPSSPRQRRLAKRNGPQG